MEFERRKAATLTSLRSEVTDKSPKGTVDTPIIPLLDVINCHRDYFTTSSCSGRISILSQPTRRTTKKKASGGAWLYITHDPADPDAVLDLVFRRRSDQDEPELHQDDEVVFRFEPLIVAVECRDVAAAQLLVSKAIAAGFRESGITNSNKRVIIAIRCSIRLEVPLGSSREIMVSREYLRFLVGVANEKFEANRKRTDAFLDSLLSESGGFVAAAQDGGSYENAHPGSDGVNGSFSLSVVEVEVSGESEENLYLWGHSACALGEKVGSEILVFGGFGGVGRHARRNQCMLVDTLSGSLRRIRVESGPSPRLGHTACLVGDCVFVIGGRADPEKVLSDVWVLDIRKNEWKLVECSGDVFPPRHRHAAAVVGAKIYVFGGLNNDAVTSSLHVLDTDDMQWRLILVNGDGPCARHSHSMVASGSQLYMFGGYDGEQALGDLYRFDTQTSKCRWKKVKSSGRCPHSRFSHSTFVYKNHLGVIGGCPVRRHCQELSILDLRLCTWRHVKLESTDEDLFVRSTANIVGDDLVMIGGGASCYAFGTKFSKPMKIKLSPLKLRDDNLKPLVRELHTERNDTVKSEKRRHQQVQNVKTLAETPDLNSKSESTADGIQVDAYWVLKLEKKYAKIGKDILKKFGWLDLARKVYSIEGGLHICFPVIAKFSDVLKENQQDRMTNLFEGQSDDICEPAKGAKCLIDELTSSKALDILKECGATTLVDEVVEVRKTTKSPSKIMSEAVAPLLKDKGLPAGLLEELPTRWERLGDIVVLPVTSFKNPLWDSIAEELWPIVAKSVNATRLARQGCVASTGTRDSTLEILIGDNGWVDHRENGILYSFDATKCMFSWGNLSEKLRMGSLDCRDEIIVDLFAGIGYFTLPFLVRAKAKLVYACEWNPHAVEALQRNVQANSVADKCIILEGDNRITAPQGLADRICLGLIPSSESSWATAVRALRGDGGMLHVHGNVVDSEENSWTKHVSESIAEIARSQGHCWEISIEHLERVKWYAPHIRHVVADVRCRRAQK
ncbi:tRNA wybutosine-synthesizing protein 2/3/4 [Argentina anserina]|uniref:tRNA wybutosine-synthesizing protein 2/3/4 n=1 Tax=Argentina anserina TaxID=57926 RepID=UPI0021763658|nr:tRNA wybutosine-synthesizing protein 2/3/4 [Potentilla anserina]